MPDAKPPLPFTSEISLEVNGRRHQIAVRRHWTLPDVLREHLDPTGASTVATAVSVDRVEFTVGYAGLVLPGTGNAGG